ncbi:hypothetical protein JAAARDRAFT_125449 [Jaapia argillacea MUCL 33604]|uniref:Mitochondrial carrier protein n=1 Tax=Jaapia argillacea MUCL 33604 TaxID=933084 RepID=A0A067Q0Q8_9AGAM|nr:hypothetical protein JAAARDRAFT_125449 [Jaapia argillacea MUCL 33604]
MSLALEDTVQDAQGNSLHAALARTATRSIALYFSRPVRLFRPSKVNGWQLLRGLAAHHGTTLTPRYMIRLIKEQGYVVIPKHFIPPMMVNAFLGTVLWTTYSECSQLLEARMNLHPLGVTALSGAVAGGVQAIAAAPAENVRLVIEGGTPRSCWSHAWKEVFRGTEGSTASSRQRQIHEAREVRQWMKEVGEMAGRGWNGWGFGCAKDICGFAVFFSIFELTRDAAASMKTLSRNALIFIDDGDDGHRSLRLHAPRFVHAMTLVCGGVAAGVAYELTCRPWDVARKTVHIAKVSSPPQKPWSGLVDKVRDDGILSFFRDPTIVTPQASTGPTNARPRMLAALRILARAGPWGAGFLVWEALRPGLS